MENISTIIESIVDDFIRNYKVKKIIYQKIFSQYSDAEIIHYYQSTSFTQIKNDLSDLGDTKCPQVLESYHNFSTINKKNYTNLLNLIISAVETYIDDIKFKQYKHIEYARLVNLSGNDYQSIVISEVNNSKTLMLYNTRNNLFYYIVGDLTLDKSGSILGIDQIYYRKFISPGYIINSIKCGENLEVDDNWELLEKTTLKINKSIFLIDCTH